MTRMRGALAITTVALAVVVLAIPAVAATTNDQVPAGLAGIWVVPFGDGNIQSLVLAGNQFAFFVENAGSRAIGDVAVDGDTITFSNGDKCSGTGVYQWSITDGALTFIALNSDPCARSARLVGGTWVRR